MGLGLLVFERCLCIFRGKSLIAKDAVFMAIMSSSWLLYPIQIEPYQLIHNLKR